MLTKSNAREIIISRICKLVDIYCPLYTYNYVLLTDSHALVFQFTLLRQDLKICEE
jgi:hypothetical protein